MPSQDGPGGAPEYDFRKMARAADLGDAAHLPDDHNPYPRGVIPAIDAQPESEATILRAQLAGLRSGVRAVAETLVRTGRVPEAEAQGMLRQLGVPLLDRQQYRMEVPVAGVAVVDVMAADLIEARVIADSIVERGTGSMISTMLPGGSRLARMSRADHAQPIGTRQDKAREVTTP